MSWSEKAGNSFGSWLAGFVLVWIGFNAKLGPQTPQTLAQMKYCYAAAARCRRAPRALAHPALRPHRGEGV